MCDNDENISSDEATLNKQAKPNFHDVVRQLERKPQTP